MAAGKPVIVTRPAREAVQWVDEFRAAGLEAAALPLIVIEHAIEVEPLNTAWKRLADYAALMFVSASAVEHFFLHSQQAQAKDAIAAGTRFWATGPGTSRALLRAGRRRPSMRLCPMPPASIPRRCGSGCEPRSLRVCAC
jgi:uroporphyrinogen-III synthase